MIAENISNLSEKYPYNVIPRGGFKNQTTRAINEA